MSDMPITPAEIIQELHAIAVTACEAETRVENRNAELERELAEARKAIASLKKSGDAMSICKTTPLAPTGEWMFLVSQHRKAIDAAMKEAHK